MSEERIVIVVMKPFAGKEATLEALVRNHHAELLEEGLATERKPILMRAADGSVIEVFGWKSKEAIEQAHHNERVQKMWAEYAEVCEFSQVGNLAEAGEMFSEFTPLD